MTGTIEKTNKVRTDTTTFSDTRDGVKTPNDTGNSTEKKTSGVDLLRYPITLGDSDDGQNNYILFNIWAQSSTPKVLLKEGSTTSQGLAAYKSKAQGGGESTVSGSNTTLVAVNQNDNTNTQASFISRGTQRINTAIAIYMPGNYKVAHSPAWDSVELSSGFALESVNRVAAEKTIQSVQNALTSKLGSNFWGAIDSAFSSSYQTIYELNKGAAVNRFVEVAFKSMANRTFSFDFLFTPISAQEAEQVRKIIKAFRYHSAPEFTGDKAYLTYPDEFDIGFYRIDEDSKQAVENTKIPRINRCVCTSVDVNYGATDWYTFKDGHPTQITLTLSFTEMVMLTKNLIDKGY